MKRCSFVIAHEIGHMVLGATWRRADTVYANVRTVFYAPREAKIVAVTSDRGGSSNAGGDSGGGGDGSDGDGGDGDDDPDDDSLPLVSTITERLAFLGLSSSTLLTTVYLLRESPFCAIPLASIPVVYIAYMLRITRFNYASTRRKSARKSLLSLFKKQFQRLLSGTGRYREYFTLIKCGIAMLVTAAGGYIANLIGFASAVVSAMLGAALMCVVIMMTNTLREYVRDREERNE